MSAQSNLIKTVLSNAQAITRAAIAYSDSIDFSSCEGDIALLIASTAGSVTITQQCSVDNSNFYDPVDKDGTALGAVVSALTVTTGKYVAVSPVIAPYIRYKIVEGDVGATALTLTLVHNIRRR